MLRSRRNLPLAAPTPGLLLLNGHRSHYNLFCEYAWDNKVILVSDLGHSIHLLQPLDVGLFVLLQKAYGDFVTVQHWVTWRTVQVTTST